MKLLVIFALLAVSLTANATDIASCSGLSGMAYYPAIGLVGESDSGWHDDTISGGITKLVKRGEGKYDIMWVDARKEVFSARNSGGTVVLLSQGDHAFSILVVYPGSTAEVYTFYKDSSGKLGYLLITSRSGSRVPITKSSVMQGYCDYINFSQLSDIADTNG